MNGIVVLSQYNLLVRGGMDQMQAILQTCTLKIRPVLMTCVIAGVGLLPAAISSGIGSQVQKPLAIVVVSGMTFAPFLILVVLPVLIALFPSRALRIRHSQTQEKLAG
jgi:cobalt-zinc-cadmium resistance protein CzcA